MYGYRSLSRRTGSSAMSTTLLTSKYDIVEDTGFKILVTEKKTNSKKLVYNINLSSVKREERRWEIMDFINEYKGLHLLPCMVNLKESFCDNVSYYVVQDIISHGTLQQERSVCLENGVTIKEESLKHWICQILLALKSLHRRKVIHGAVVPENIYLCGRKDSIRLGPTAEFLSLHSSPKDLYKQISTFKTAKASDSRGGSERFITAMTGLESLEHIAPEMFNPSGEIAYSNDIWGLGIVAYKLAAGEAPFTGNTPVHVVMSIEKIDPDFDFLLKKGYSNECVNIIKQLLEKDHSKRPTAAKLLESDYFPATMNFG